MSSTSGSARAGGREELAHLRRGFAIPVVSPKPISAAPGLGQPPRDREHPLGRHVPLVGAAERRRDHALAAQPLGPRASERPLEPGQRLLDRPADVLLVVGLRGRQEAVDLLKARAVRERPLEPALVRDQHADRDLVAAADARRAPPRRRRAAGSRRAGRSSSPRAAAGRSRRAARSAGPCRRSRSPRARSGTRRADRPRGSERWRAGAHAPTYRSAAARAASVTVTNW